MMFNSFLIYQIGILCVEKFCDKVCSDIITSNDTTVTASYRNMQFYIMYHTMSETGCTASQN